MLFLLAYDCMLRSCNAKIQHLHDPDMILFVEQNIRGGLSYINQRYCKEGEHIDKAGEKSFTEMIYVDGE